MAFTKQLSSKFISVADAARCVDYTYVGFRNLALKRDDLPAIVRVGKHYAMDRTDFERWAAGFSKPQVRRAGLMTDRLARIEMLLEQLQTDRKRAA